MGGRVEHREGARDLPSLVLHQGDAQPLQGGGGKLAEMENKIGWVGKHTALGEPVRLDRVRGDGDDVTLLALEGGGERAEEAGRHRQEIALNMNDDQNDKDVEDDEERIWRRDLIEDEHSVEPVEGSGVEVLDLASQGSQTSEGGHKIARLHSSTSCNFGFFSLKLDNLPVQESNTY